MRNKISDKILNKIIVKVRGGWRGMVKDPTFALFNFGTRKGKKIKINPP